ncbi:hypothetical protein GGI21_002962 [Coemansia aciculifera]|nr:hypothetical protein GGI21_002962 [Coemansia aciculifera]
MSPSFIRDISEIDVDDSDDDEIHELYIVADTYDYVLETCAMVEKNYGRLFECYNEIRAQGTEGKPFRRMSTGDGKPQVWIAWGTIASPSDIHAKLHQVVQSFNNDGNNAFAIKAAPSVFNLLHKPESED